MVKWNRSGLRLADVPGSGSSRIDSNAASGNPRHDTRSGKFGAGGRPAKPGEVPAPANVDPVEYKKMLDAARDAARQFDVFSDAEITKFIQERATSPEQVDLQNFMNLVVEHRKTDVLDMLAQELGGAGQIKVVSQASVTQLLRALSAADVTEIITRLESMGHARKAIDAAMGDIQVVEEAQAKKEKEAA